MFSNGYSPLPVLHVLYIHVDNIKYYSPAPPHPNLYTLEIEKPRAVRCNNAGFPHVRLLAK